MSSLTVSALFFTQRCSEAANASQSEHRFRSHTKEERQSFEHMLERQTETRKSHKE